VRSDIPDSEVLPIYECYEHGHYVQAHRHAEKLPPIPRWRGTRALLIAGRIAGNLEAPHLSNALHLRAWREDRRSAEAACYRGYSLQHRRGPLATWRFLNSLPDFPDAEPEHRASLLALKGQVAAMFRDFAQADAFLREAEAVDGLTPWLCVERSQYFQARDAYGDALAISRRALEMRPFFRPAVQSAAHLLTLLDRDDEAIALLCEASGHLESPAVTQQLASLLTEHERHAEALAELRRMRELAVMMEPRNLEAWNAGMSDALYFVGDFAGAAEHARLAGPGFHAKIAERLASPAADARRVHLRVPFVRQHEMTCAPATLSAISRYWRVEVDHLELARRICYDGTPGHVERHWAEETGFAVREFRADWPTCVALLDRGVPFTLSTVETTSAHAQALVGYDSRRGTLLIRDPYRKLHSEAFGVEWLEQYAPFGPRALAFVPREEAHRFDGIVLPETELYDHVYRLDRALHVHDRDAAEQALASLAAVSPGGRLTLFAQRQLAGYDASAQRAHAMDGELLKLYPQNRRLLWSRLWSLRELAPPAEVRDFLAGLARAKDAEPIFWREHAEELRKDARGREDANRWIARALRSIPLSAECIATLAYLRWDERRFSEGAALLRLAACLRDKAEHFSRSWFLAARHLRCEAEVLAVFEARFAENGAQSAEPAQMLFWALEVLDRNVEAFAKLDAALALRPDDGALLIFAADMHARRGQDARARELLDAAQPKANRAAWLRTAAAMADYRCDLHEAHVRWGELLAEQPLAMDAQNAVARLTAEISGRAAAIAHLDAQCARFPHHVLLQRLRVEWLRADGADAAEAALRRVIALDPSDAWAHRELAVVLCEQRLFDDAFAACEAATAVAPDAPATVAVRAWVLQAAGRHAEACEAYRSAIRLSVDHTQAIEGLVAASDSIGEKRDALAFVREQMIAQTVYGDGLLAYQDAAYPILEHEDLLALLREALAARPDLWHAWSALAAQLLNMSRVVEAHDIARQAAERFPLLPRVWHDLGRIQLAHRDTEGAMQSFRRALSINPAWGLPSRSLAGALGALGRYDEACGVLETAIAATPLDPSNHAQLAEVLWRRNRDPAAIERLRHVIAITPDFGWAWDRYAEWSHVPGGENPAVALAREIAAKRTGDPRAALRLAEMLPPKQCDEALAVLDGVLARDPRNISAHDLRARLLANAGRFDEALAACRPAGFADRQPVPLDARAAWVTRERGHIKEAREMMRAVVARAPDHGWAWEMIAAWSNTLKDHITERDAAQQLVRLNPRGAMPHAYLAQAEERLGRRPAALAALRRAWDLDPAYEYAAFAIFDAQCEKGHAPSVEDTLQRLRLHIPGTRTLAAEVRWLCRCKKRKDAVARFAELASVPEADGTWLRVAADDIMKQGWQVDAAVALLPALERPGVNPEAGYVFARIFAAAKPGDAEIRIRAIDGTSPAGRRARVGLLEILGERRDVKGLLSAMGKERDLLHSHTDTWGSAGYAFVACGEYAEGEKWIAGWREREGVEAWMLGNVAWLLRCRGHDEQAVDASRRALTMPRDGTFNMHHAWLALDAALAERTDEWKQHRDSVAHDQVQPFERTVLMLARAIVDVQQAPASERGEAFATWRENLRATEHRGHLMAPPLDSCMMRALKLMSRLSGTEYHWDRWVRKAQRRAAREVPHHAPKERRIPVGVIIFIIIAIIRVLVALLSDRHP
jgi:tetratricopeptide (TPR) repeat protein